MTAFIKKVVFTIDFNPAGGHDAVFVKIIAIAVDGSPPADTITVFIKIIGLVFNCQPGFVIGAVAFDITPYTVLEIPFSRPVSLPECSAGQFTTIDRDASSACRCLKMIAIILSCIICAVSIVFDGSQMIFNARIMILELVIQISELSVNGRIIIAIGLAPALQTTITAACPLTETIASAACIPSVRVKGGLTADICHDSAGSSLGITKLCCQYFKYIVGILGPCRS